MSYRTDLTFQYLAPDAAQPDDITFTDVQTALPPGAQVPAVGDIVTLQISTPRNPSERRWVFESFKVVGRNFVYSNATASGGTLASGAIIHNVIYIIVSDLTGNEIGLNFRD
jgi:hypothetical protein